MGPSLDRRKAPHADDTTPSNATAGPRTGTGSRLSHEVSRVVGTSSYAQDRKLFLGAVQHAESATDHTQASTYWEEAATRLNGFQDSDITASLADIAAGPNGGQMLDQLLAGAYSAGYKGSGNAERIDRLMEPVRKERQRIDDVYSAYDKAKNDVATAPPDKPDKKAEANLAMAKALNGMSVGDIRTRLADLDLSGLRDLETAHDKSEMVTWPGPLHDEIVARLAVVEAAAVDALADQPPEVIDTHVVSRSDRQTVTASKAEPNYPAEANIAKLAAGPQARLRKALAERDAKAQEFGAADYDDYVHNMLVGGGPVFGVTINAAMPVHPVLLERLRRASAIAALLLGTQPFGVKGLGGFKDAVSLHAWGFAVDIDSNSNQYILNESGEAELDDKLVAVYENIAQALLHRHTVITRPTATSPGGLESATYDQLADENEAMIAYFKTLGMGYASTLPQLRPTPRPFDQKDLDALKTKVDQIKADYDLLTTRKGTFVGKSGKVLPGVDGPAAGATPKSDRNPTRGFMSVNQYVVAAMKQVGLNWGATGLGPESGDVMHFDGRSDEFRRAVVEYGRQHPTAARAAKDTAARSGKP